MENYTLMFIIDVLTLWFGTGFVGALFLTIILIADKYPFTLALVFELWVQKVFFGPFYLFKVIEGWYMGNDKKKKEKK
jgi:hypothetical protein